MSTVTQGAFAQALLDPALPAPEGLRNPGGAPATRRYDIYRNNVAVSLTEALETAFPALRKLLGDTFFRAMAGVYLRKHPPTSPLMMHYGHAMPQFVRRFPPTRAYAYLPDVARLELALRRAYHAADAASVSPQDLAALAPERLMQARITFAPAVQVIASEYPVLGIYRAQTAGTPNPAMVPETALVTRARFDPELHLLNAAEAACVTALQEGHSLGAAMGLAGPALDLGALLSRLLAQNAITAIS